MIKPPYVSSPGKKIIHPRSILSLQALPKTKKCNAQHCLGNQETWGCLFDFCYQEIKAKQPLHSLYWTAIGSVPVLGKGRQSLTLKSFWGRERNNDKTSKYYDMCGPAREDDQIRPGAHERLPVAGLLGEAEDTLESKLSLLYRDLLFWSVLSPIRLARFLSRDTIGMLNRIILHYSRQSCLLGHPCLPVH